MSEGQRHTVNITENSSSRVISISRMVLLSAGWFMYVAVLCRDNTIVKMTLDVQILALLCRWSSYK